MNSFNLAKLSENTCRIRELTHLKQLELGNCFVLTAMFGQITSPYIYVED